MHYRRIKRIISLILFVMFLFIMNSPNLAFAQGKEIEATDSENLEIGELTRYRSYRSQFPDTLPTTAAHINATDYIWADDEALEERANSLVTSDKGSVKWEFNIEESGLYNIEIKYYPISGNGSAIQRTLKIDDAIPFDEASNLSFYRYWTNESESTFQNGNEIRPRQIEAPEWIVYVIGDRNKLNAGAYEFFLEAGSHTLTFEALRETLELEYIKFVPAKKSLPTYQQQLAAWKNAGYEEIEMDKISYVQGEDAYLKSSPSLYASTDNTSPLTQSQHLYKIRLNIIGGVNWRLVGDFIEWEVTVPQTGLYQISLRVKQDLKQDLNVIRDLYINREIPFAECRNLEFSYKNKFYNYTIGGENPYYFLLNEGKNTIRLEVSLGKYAKAIDDLKTMINNLNSLYREIIVITGTSPDANRDYELNKYIPSLKERLTERRTEVKNLITYLVETENKKTKETVVLNKMLDLLDGFIENTYSIPASISSFNSNISSLGTCLNDLMEQPLQIDYLMIHDAGQKLPKGEANFFQKIWFELKKLIISFFVDYDSLGSEEINEEESIEVWVLTGRDQAQIIKNLAMNDFTKKFGAPVKIKLVPSAALLPNTLIGSGPDVALMVGNGVPVQYAFRNASYDISQFPDFEEFVAENFYPSSLVNFEYNGGVYGLPETQTFPVMFYREDIIVNQLGLSIPNTWEEMIDLLNQLQRYRLDVYLGQSSEVDITNINSVFAAMLYQKGGSFYLNEGRMTGLREEVAVKTFIEWTSFYTQYNCPTSANFLNRFRSGEMPIGIADYSTYNSLMMFAPEINGKWKMTLLPGTVNENGEIDRSCMSSGTSAFMMKNAKNKDIAWKFLKWWTSTDIQVQYGREIESVLGSAARYQTANYKAMEQLAWQTSDLRTLKEQFKWAKGFPQMPGGYMTPRQLNNAFRKVINSNMNPREMLLKYTVEIDTEINYKRKEFGLD